MLAAIIEQLRLLGSADQTVRQRPCLHATPLASRNDRPLGNRTKSPGLKRTELQKLANELKIPITVCHLPPGTSKWNKIEHRLFSFITINWRGKPLRSYRTIVQLISATTTNTGLKVRAELDETELDENKYPKGVKVSDLQMAAVNLTRHSFHGDWNYTVSPQRKNSRQKRID